MLLQKFESIAIHSSGTMKELLVRRQQHNTGDAEYMLADSIHVIYVQDFIVLYKERFGSEVYVELYRFRLSRFRRRTITLEQSHLQVAYTSRS